jgi:hypothetical protein
VNPIDEFGDWLSSDLRVDKQSLEIAPKTTAKVRILIGDKSEYQVQVFDFVSKGSGLEGVGFLNPISWSFIGEKVKAIAIENLILAYAGWAFLFTGVNNGKITTRHEGFNEKSNLFISTLRSSCAHESIKPTVEYSMDEGSYLEYKGLWRGQPIRGVWSNGYMEKMFFTNDMPEYSLDPIYFMLGQHQQ